MVFVGFLTRLEPIEMFLDANSGNFDGTLSPTRRLELGQLMQMKVIVVCWYIAALQTNQLILSRAYITFSYLNGSNICKSSLLHLMGNSESPSHKNKI